ncbi:MAG: hypothetical protein Ta2B_23300 [Termitinemataceae bacterium]|nr:MAG: hypothetical protein Ta2B_23300 [Termitinemataceae bacterium]
MKKSAILLGFILVVSVGALSAQDSFSLGLGLEVDGFTVGDADAGKDPLFGLGPLVTLDYRFNEMFSLGARGILSFDLAQSEFGYVSSVEFDFAARWYFLRFKSLVDYWFEWQHKYHYFVQFDIGYLNVLSKSNEDLAGIGTAVGGTVGCRIFLFESFFIEPFGRFGVNMSKNVTALNWGIGAVAGYTFHSTRGGY